MNQRRLVLDLGNTRLKMGLFEGDDMVHSKHHEASDDLVEIWEEWKNNYHPERIAISTTVTLTGEQDIWIRENQVLPVGTELQYPFHILYKTPETLGPDRLAAVSGVYALYSGSNVLVIDCGSCITYDFLMADGRYMGGNIAPGIRMRLLAMHNYTHRLPLILPPDRHLGYIGQSTEEALQIGGGSMAVLEANGLIFYLREKYGPLITVLTGGDSWYFENHLSGEHYLYPDLVLSGLNEILKYNEI